MTDKFKDWKPGDKITVTGIPEHLKGASFAELCMGRLDDKAESKESTPKPADMGTGNNPGSR